MNATQKLILSWVQAEGAPLGSRRDTSAQVFTGEIADATDAVAYHTAREVAANDIDAIDLKAVTQEVLGVPSTLVFASLLMVSVRSRASSQGDFLHVGADPDSPGNAYSVRLHPGAWMGICSQPDGWAVTEQNRWLVVANMGQQAIPYDLVIIGRRSEP